MSRTSRIAIRVAIVLVLGLVPTIRYPDAIVAGGLAWFVWAHRKSHAPFTKHLIAGALGVVIGFYDGLIGPGTGTFLIMTLITALGYDFLQASAKAKIVNVATNAGALLFFIPQGHVLWVLGLAMGAANTLGAWLGSRTAVARGNRFIRIAFLVVVAALIIKVGHDVWVENLEPLFAS